MKKRILKRREKPEYLILRLTYLGDPEFNVQCPMFNS